MTRKVGVKGQVVIPKTIRDRIGIRPGDEVAFDSDDHEVRIRRVEDVDANRTDKIRALRGIWSDDGTGTDALLTERRKERELEERRAGDAALVVFDSWALLAYLGGEPAADRVESAWLDEGAAISSVNLGEVLYIRMRQEGEESAAATVDQVRDLLQVIDPDWPLVSRAASIKAPGGLSYADAFGIATAIRAEAPLWTGDPEIVGSAARHSCEVVDLRT